MSTSETSPIRVDILPVEATLFPGTIGLTFAPGKVDPGRWQRNLDVDLARLRDVYGTQVLVTLLEPHELRMLDIERLFAAAEHLGIQTHHFPIPDVSIPSDAAKLISLVRSILAAAAQGKNVVVHCRGGIGRAGAVSACALAALGHEPEEAIAIVRAVRAGALETREQEAFVSTFARAWHAAGERPSRRDVQPSFARVAGCLLGGALGDALGYPIEFTKSAAAIEARFGAGPPLDLAYTTEAALISDDTQMTLFSIEGLVRARQAGITEPAHTTEFLLGAYQRWHATQAMGAAATRLSGRGWLVAEPGLFARRAPGNTCMSALFTRPTPTINDAPNGSKGCGAVMRSAPFGIAMRTREEAFVAARDAGVLTHGHPSGYLSGAYLAAVVFDLLRGAPLPDALRGADELLAREQECEETAQAISRAVVAANAGTLNAAAIEALGGGWVGEEALAIGIACAISCRSAAAIPATLWRAVAHAGDSDSTGSVAGNLLGAICGAAALPSRWLVQLELHGVIERAARDLFASCILGCRLDTDSYPREHGRFKQHV